MKLTQTEIEATVKDTLDKDCFEAYENRCDWGTAHLPGGSLKTTLEACRACHRNENLAREIANALALKYLEKYRFVRPREATDSVTSAQALKETE